MDLIYKAANASSLFEETNTELKREYLKKYIDTYNEIVLGVSGFKGSFGTGYPFYIFDENMKGKIPVIQEQLRYNNDLIKSVHDYLIYPNFRDKKYVWGCENCLSEKSDEMPDLKSICKSCPNVPKELKPRKIINRLPDIDLWMVVEDGYEDVVKKILIELFNRYDMHTSDIDPIKTISDVSLIAEQLSKGIMPTKYIPLDTHIISYSTLYNLINSVTAEMSKAKVENRIPYLPILPFSLRKTWQTDDVAYNFIHDYLYALTDFNFEHDLKESLTQSRKDVIANYSVDELARLAIITGSECVARRQQEAILKERFNERMESWKRL